MSLLKPMSKKKKPMPTDDGMDDSAPMAPKGKGSLAMAFAARRNVGSKKKMMAQGGEISAADESRASIDEKMARDMEMLKGASMKQSAELDARDESEGGNSIDDAKDEREMSMYAKGGMVDSIMRKRKMMASGGEVDLEENAEVGANTMDELNRDAADSDVYDDSQLSAQPEDSNEHGDKLSDADAHDMVSMIRKKLKSLK